MLQIFALPDASNEFIYSFVDAFVVLNHEVFYGIFALANGSQEGRKSVLATVLRNIDLFKTTLLREYFG